MVLILTSITVACGTALGGIINRSLNGFRSRSFSQSPRARRSAASSMSGTRGVGNSRALPGRGSHFEKSVTPGWHHPSSRWSAASPETPHKASNASDGSARGPGRGRESIVGCVREGKRRRGVDVLGEVRRDERREGNRRPGGEARRDDRGGGEGKKAWRRRA